MITRRSLLGTAAAVAGVAGALTVAGLTHRLDDVAGVVGLDPKPEPDPADDALLRDVATAQATLLASVRATASQHASLELATLEQVGQEHLDAVGGSTAADVVSRVPDEKAEAVSALAKAYGAAAKARASQADKASAPELLLVLASMSASLTQCSRVAGSLR